MMFRLYIIVSLVYSCVYAGTLPQNRFSMDGRILGGRNITIEEVPHQVSILLAGTHNCGGSILSERWILTAAHCIEYYNIVALQVNVNSSLYNDGGVTYSISKLVIHPNHNTSFYDNDYDYGLIELATPLKFGTGVQPIGLPDQGKELTAGTVVQVTGYGRLTSGGLHPEVLQIVEVPVFSQTLCNKQYNGEITNRMLCTTEEVGGKNPCQGDTGGPLVAADGKLYGVVSWGQGCAQRGLGYVYAKVSDQVNWIRSVIGL